MLRSPAVANQFYPGNRSALESVLARLIPPIEAKQHAFGIMSPHAGYIYSGKVAGHTFARIKIPREVVILGPNHHGFGHQASMFHRGGWETPLGVVPIAEDLADAILSSCPIVAADVTAHRFEHSLEVQVPFLQTLVTELSIVPICIGRLSLENLLNIGDSLATAFQGRTDHPLIVASSDMTHYETGERARHQDQLALDKIVSLDPDGLYKTVSTNRISMCGVLPTVIMLQACRRLGATNAEVVLYSNSGDVTGDQSEVVGYAGVIIS